MIRWGALLIAAMLLPCAARADDVTAGAAQAFAAICSTVLDEKPDIASIVKSAGMVATLVDGGRPGTRVFLSPQTKQTIIVSTNAYSDAHEVNCRSVLAQHTDRPELESLAQSLKLDGSFVESKAGLIGAWKRPRNQPLVMVVMSTNAASTLLSMQRIDTVADSEKK
jgi:hypothetical protein